MPLETLNSDSCNVNDLYTHHTYHSYQNQEINFTVILLSITRDLIWIPPIFPLMCFLCSRIQSRIPYRVYLSGLFNLQSLTVSQSFLVFHELDTLLTGCFFKLAPVSCYQAPSFSKHFLTFWKHKMSQTHSPPLSFLKKYPDSFFSSFLLLNKTLEICAIIKRNSILW